MQNPKLAYEFSISDLTKQDFLGYLRPSILTKADEFFIQLRSFLNFCYGANGPWPQDRLAKYSDFISFGSDGSGGRLITAKGIRQEAAAARHIVENLGTILKIRSEDVVRIGGQTIELKRIEHQFMVYRECLNRLSKTASKRGPRRNGLKVRMVALSANFVVGCWLERKRSKRSSAISIEPLFSNSDDFLEKLRSRSIGPTAEGLIVMIRNVLHCHCPTFEYAPLTFIRDLKTLRLDSSNQLVWSVLKH